MLRLGEAADSPAKGKAPGQNWQAQPAAMPFANVFRNFRRCMIL
jgi:hypothetical protein